MKKLIVLLFLVFIGCSNPVNNNNNTTNPLVPTDPTDPANPTNPTTPTTPSTPDPVDPAFWFKEMYEELIERVSETSSEGYADIADPSGIDAGQIVNKQYVCDAISEKWGTTYTPEAGTVNQAADCEYLLKMIDEANNGLTSCGTSEYATNQVIDTTAVEDAVNRWVPGSKFVILSYYGSYPGGASFYSTSGLSWGVYSDKVPENDWRSICYGGD
jgi:hypothetical protein